MKPIYKSDRFVPNLFIENIVLVSYTYRNSNDKNLKRNLYKIMKTNFELDNCLRTTPWDDKTIMKLFNKSLKKLYSINDDIKIYRKNIEKELLDHVISGDIDKYLSNKLKTFRKEMCYLGAI